VPVVIFANTSVCDVADADGIGVGVGRGLGVGEAAGVGDGCVVGIGGALVAGGLPEQAEASISRARAAIFTVI
jgi:hypothetical protein